MTTSLNVTIDVLTDDHADFLRYILYESHDEGMVGYEVEDGQTYPAEVEMWVESPGGEKQAEQEFTPEELRAFTREWGHYLHENDSLGVETMNYLNRFYLLASYLEGEIRSEEEMNKLQREFEADHDFVRSGLKTLQFRKSDRHF